MCSSRTKKKQKQNKNKTKQNIYTNYIQDMLMRLKSKIEYLIVTKQTNKQTNKQKNEIHGVG